MSKREAGHVAPQRVAPDKLWSQLVRRVLVTIAVRSDPHHAAIRASTLAVAFGLAFALLGTIRHYSATEYFAHSPFKFDLALRAVSKGWFVSDRTIPVTIVDIDEATHGAWGSPAVTPREPLTQLLEIVTAAHPAAVVTDIDLSFGDGANGAADAGSRRLRQFLEQYAESAPLIFPKRLEPAPDGMRKPAISPFDDVFERNSKLAWAHADFQTGGGGAVRNWQDWLAVCIDSRPVWMPSVETRLAAQLAELPPGLDRPVTPASGAKHCHEAGDSSSHAQRLLVGPRLTGEDPPAPQPDARAVSAALLLEPQLARNDAQLFGGRVVFIGATHVGSGDFWLTSSGVLPGVELLANTVRYAPVQRESLGVGVRMIHRAVALLLFVYFVFVERRLRGLAALFFVTVGALAVVALGLAVFEDLGVLDAVEAAVLLFIAYKTVETVLGFIADVKAKRLQFKPGLAGWFQALGAACLREREAHHR